MNKFVLIAIVLASISGVGALSHNVFQIDLQSLQVFSSIDEFTDSVCSCEGDDGFFSPANCEGFAPGGEYTDPNGVCTELASSTDYGEPPVLADTQGCGVGFWKNNVAVDPSIASIESASPSVWPLGYQPDYYYADMFQTTLVQSQNVIAGNEEVVDDNSEADPTDPEVIIASADEDNSEADPTDPEIIIASADEDNSEADPDNSESDKGLTLSDALELERGDMNDLLRQSVAAMLNAAHSDINYPYTVPQIIAMTQIALNSENYESVSDEFEENNENLDKPLFCLE